MPPPRPGRARRRAVLAALAIGLIFAWRLSSAPIVDPTAASPDSATCATRTRGDPARAAPMKLDLASDPVASDDDKFTVVLNTFRRRDMLVRSIRHYASCAHHIAEIRVQWSEQVPVPELDGPGPDYFGPPTLRRCGTTRTPPRPYRIDSTSATSPPPRCFTSMTTFVSPCATLARAHAAWKSNRDAVVGFYPRAHRWDAKKCKHEYVWGDVSLRLGGAFSVVLTKAAFTRTEYLRLYADHLPEEARRYVDERKNCEDIAMQLVASAATGAAPVYVPVPALRYWWDKLAGFGVAGISKGGGAPRRAGGVRDGSLADDHGAGGRAGRREHTARRRAAASVVRAVAHSVTTSDERDERERSRA